MPTLPFFLVLFLLFYSAIPNRLTLAPCRSNIHCAPPRLCRASPFTPLKPCSAKSSRKARCRCIPPFLPSCNSTLLCPPDELCATDSAATICVTAVVVHRNPRWTQIDSCHTDDDCESGTVCALGRALKLPVCAPQYLVESGALTAVDAMQGSESPEPSPEAGQKVVGGGVCVDAGLLGHLEKKDVVFEEDVWAEVLCDSWGSCATGGHLVVVEGKAMMMRRYCARVNCERRIMRVNSPRWSTGVRVASRTKHLVFTAFAARFETKVEEIVLQNLVRIGL